ncbi:hypothetical protein ACA910_005238 [Epithemia clementina (nom. ined.)]
MMSSPSSHASDSASVRIAQSHLPRSTSMDRRLCEAAQYAEAIGDANVAQQIEIVDDDDDDDDEGDEKIQHVCSVPVSVSIVQDSIVGSHRISHQAEYDVMSASNARDVSGLQQEEILSRRNHKMRLARTRDFLEQLPAGQVSGQSDFVYKGVLANPPDVVMRGIQRGNYAQLHRKAWLEVSDKHHRYGKNLRFYYRHWESLGYPTNIFFDWLDSKGESAGQPLPEIDECPRAQLDADTVLYITDPEVTANYCLTFIPDEMGRGRVVDIFGDPVITGPGGWIFVLRDNLMYGAQKITSMSGQQTKERFHHSSFFGGKAVASAGIFITDEVGFLTKLYPHSGHYRPREVHTQCVLFFLHHQGVDLKTFDVDMQQILHVAREKDMSTKAKDKAGKMEQVCDQSNQCTLSSCEKKKKVDSLFLTPAVLVACFLAHKARLLGAGFFEQIHRIQGHNPATVREALHLIRNRGYR